MLFQLGHIEKVEAKDQFLDIGPPHMLSGPHHLPGAFYLTTTQ